MIQIDSTHDTSFDEKDRLIMAIVSKGPLRSKDIFYEIRKKKSVSMSKPTFSRHLRYLKEHSDVYVLSDEEKKAFNLIGKDGNPQKWRYYYRIDRNIQKGWEKIKEKIKKYDGSAKLYRLFSIINRDYANFPLVSVDDLIEIIDVFRNDKKDMSESRGELLKFLGLQVKRMSNLVSPSDKERLANKLIDLFQYIIKDLLGPTGGNVIEPSTRAFEILCNVVNSACALVTIKGILEMDVPEEKQEQRNKILRDLLESYSVNFKENNLSGFLEGEIHKLQMEEIEQSTVDQLKSHSIGQLRYTLQRYLYKLDN